MSVLDNVDNTSSAVALINNSGISGITKDMVSSGRTANPSTLLGSNITIVNGSVVKVANGLM